MMGQLMRPIAPKPKKEEANKQVWRCTTSNLNNQYESQ
jgi:hypothetical protein